MQIKRQPKIPRQFQMDKKVRKEKWKKSKLTVFANRLSKNISSKKVKSLRLMLRPSTGPKIFWAGPKFLSQTKNLYTFCGSTKNFVPHQKMIST